MKLRCKKPHPLEREERTYRDDRLFIIATEDTYAPEQYFAVLRNPRIKVRVLVSEGGLSSPEHVIARLDTFSKEYDLRDWDELWLMLDTDHWVTGRHAANFTNVCTQALQKGYHLAHSNPCFEIWLLLHHRDVGPNEEIANGQQAVEQLKIAWGTYSTHNLDATKITDFSIGQAIARAEKLDPSDARWPQKTGSHVYRVVKKLVPTR